MNLWKLKRGQCVEVKLKTRAHVPGVTMAAWTFTHDFNTMLGQLFQEVDQDELPEVVEVCGEPIDDFAAWVEGQEPEWDRYEPETAQVAVERGLMPEEAYRLEHGVSGAPAWWKRFDEATWERLVRAGLDRYLENLGKGIRGEPGTQLIPPLIRIEGVPADGRHRTWTALKLRRKIVPVIDVRPIDVRPTATADQNRAARAPSIPDFAERYMITAARSGRVYGYDALLDLAVRQARRSPFSGMRQADPTRIRALVEEALHDDVFMHSLWGQIPARAVEEIENRVWERLRAA